MTKPHQQNKPMMQDNQTQNEKGEWILATPVPYYPNLIEKLKHLFGIHIYPEFDEKQPHGTPQCLICYKYKIL